MTITDGKQMEMSFRVVTEEDMQRWEELARAPIGASFPTQLLGAARNGIPALVAEVRRLRAIVDHTCVERDEAADDRDSLREDRNRWQAEAERHEAEVRRLRALVPAERRVECAAANCQAVRAQSPGDNDGWVRRKFSNPNCTLMDDDVYLDLCPEHAEARWLQVKP